MKALLSTTVIASLLFLGPLASASFASGTSTIAGAPGIDTNQIYFGNTAADPTDAAQIDYCHHEEWWSVSLTVGDMVSISGQESSPATDIAALVYSPGTNDLNVGSERSLRVGRLNDGVSFTADRSGDYPVAVANCGGPDGPFHFEVSVAHVAELFFPARASFSRSKIDQLAGAVRYGDGSPVSSTAAVVRLYAHYAYPKFAPATWHAIAAAHPANGVVKFRFRLPRSAPTGFVVRATIAGGMFKRVASKNVRVATIK